MKEIIKEKNINNNDQSLILDFSTFALIMMMIRGSFAQLLDSDNKSNNGMSTTMADDMWRASKIWTYCMEVKKPKDLTVDNLENCINNFVELQANLDVPSENIVQAFQRFILDVTRVV